MLPTHIKAKIEVIPDFNASNPRAQEIVALHLIANGESLEYIADDLAEMEGNTVVAAIDNANQVIAIAALKRMQDIPEGIITKVATRPDHFGRGLGSQTVGRVVELAAQEGLTHLHVFPSPGSHSLYTRQGFKHDPQKSFNPSWATKELYL